jgi:hypothetical protein
MTVMTARLGGYMKHLVWVLALIGLTSTSHAELNGWSANCQQLADTRTILFEPSEHGTVISISNGLKDEQKQKPTWILRREPVAVSSVDPEALEIKYEGLHVHGRLRVTSNIRDYNASGTIFPNLERFNSYSNFLCQDLKYQVSPSFVEAKAAFERATVPGNLSTLVGGYAGICVDEFDRIELPIMYFGYFKTQRSGNTYFGSNIGTSNESVLNFWDDYQKAVLGQDDSEIFGPLQGTGARVANGSYVTYQKFKRDEDSFLVNYETRYREGSNGSLLTHVISSDGQPSLCLWRKVLACNMVPESYQGPVRCGEH